MASDAVAAGEGAFSTWMRFSRRTMRKSSAIRPSGSTAIARTPEGEAVRSSARISGTSRCSRRVKARFEGAVDLVHPDAPLAKRQPAEPGIARQLPEIAEVQIAAAVPLAGEGEHRIRARVHLLVEVSVEVHPEEREPRVGRGVDQAADQSGPFRPDPEVLAPKGHHLQFRFIPRQSRHPVGVEAGTGDEPPAGEIPFGGENPDRAVRPGKPEDPRAGLHPAPRSLEETAERRRHFTETNHPGGRGVERRDPLGVGFDLAERRPVQQAEAGNAVRFAAPLQLVEPTPFGLVRGDNHLARQGEGNRVFPAETEQQLHSAAAVAGP